MPHSTILSPALASENELLSDTPTYTDQLSQEESNTTNGAASIACGTKSTSKSDITLEDLFSEGEDEDKEEPSSFEAANENIGSSQQAAPM